MTNRQKWSVPFLVKWESNRLNSFALSNTDIMEALKNSSSAMAVANNTLDETIALITAGNEIVQDASKVGNGLRTGFCAYVQKCA